MKTYESTCELPVTPPEAFAWHERPGAFERLAPPWQRVQILETANRLEDGSRLRFEMRKGPIRIGWLAEHRNVKPGRSFEDIQIEGPFVHWEHRHDFLPGEEGRTLMRDRIQYSLPGGPVGNLVAASKVRDDLARLFGYRYRTLRSDLAFHHHFAARPRLRVAISGSTGLIGTALSAFLATGGHQVLRLVRSPSGADSSEISWNSEQGILEPEKAEGLDAVVHLAGENIASGRWTPDRMERIRNSRLIGSRTLVDSLTNLRKPPEHFLSASAIGIYGDCEDEVLDESSPAGRGFLADVCSDWEQSTLRAADLGMRTAALRFGVVLSPLGGALAKMLPPFRLGAGGVLGSGQQYMSWISLDDVVGAIAHVLLTPEVSGPINVTAPEPVTNRAFTSELGRALHRPTWTPMPSPALRLLFGRMADETLLASARVLPQRLLGTGYSFRHPQLSTALQHLLGVETA